MGTPSHSCFLCSSDNPDVAVFGDVIRYPDRYVGPPQRAHGGIAVGSLLCPVRAAEGGENWAHFVSGRLRRPIPLNKDLGVELVLGELHEVSVADEDGLAMTGTVRLQAGDFAPETFIQEAPEELRGHLEEMAPLANAPLAGPSLISQSSAYQDKTSRGGINGCYGCSEQSHALRHKMYRTAGSDIVSQFLPEPVHFDDQGRLDTGIIAAVTDCPNLWVLMAQHADLGAALQAEEGRIWITGTHSVHYLRVPGRQKEFRVVTRILSQEGRKGLTTAALFDLDGTLYAVAEAVSILIDVPPEMM
ncbi:MAG: hypothetical protein EP340_10465 [Alphaproteobacteria bacterium]|nr:MAG: hypothetical protein EP340_10465 [Alphaproteobacteria bacterium]